MDQFELLMMVQQQQQHVSSGSQTYPLRVKFAHNFSQYFGKTNHMVMKTNHLLKRYLWLPKGNVVLHE